MKTGNLLQVALGAAVTITVIAAGVYYGQKYYAKKAAEKTA